jgi:hypothetical protein
MAEAAAGTGKKIEMFKALGISMEQLKSGDATAVFLAISAAMSGSADDSERLLIATSFFGDKIGNDIIPLLADYQKLSKDIANAPIVDAKTLKLIGDYNDGVDRLNSGLKVMIANLFGVYDAYYKWSSKVAEDIASGMFGILNKVGIGGAASNAVTNMAPLTPLGFAAVKSGLADGNVRSTASPVIDSKKNDAAKAILAAIAGTTKAEKEKASDTKGKTGGNAASSVSGNVIGVGQNPVIAALQDQTEIAKQSMTYLEMIAYNFGPQNKFRDITEKGGTPITPATR